MNQSVAGESVMCACYGMVHSHMCRYINLNPKHTIVQQLVIQKQFELALQVAVSVSCSSRVLFLYQERLIVFLNDVAGADQRV